MDIIIPTANSILIIILPKQLLYLNIFQKIRDKIFTQNTIDFLENIVSEAKKINYTEVYEDALRSLAHCREMRKDEKIKDLSKLFKYAKLKIENKHYGKDTIDILNEIIHESEKYNIKENYEQAKKWLEYCFLFYYLIVKCP